MNKLVTLLLTKKINDGKEFSGKKYIAFWLGAKLAGGVVTIAIAILLWNVVATHSNNVYQSAVAELQNKYGHVDTLNDNYLFDESTKAVQEVYGDIFDETNCIDKIDPELCNKFKESGMVHSSLLDEESNTYTLSDGLYMYRYFVDTDELLPLVTENGTVVTAYDWFGSIK